jgi:hypothetical protein
LCDRWSNCKRGSLRCILFLCLIHVFFKLLSDPLHIYNCQIPRLDKRLVSPLKSPDRVCGPTPSMGTCGLLPRGLVGRSVNLTPNLWLPRLIKTVATPVLHLRLHAVHSDPSTSTCTVQISCRTSVSAGLVKQIVSPLTAIWSL